MIARLSGTLLEKNPPYLVIDINGVGYEVEAPLGLFSDLPENGKQVAILIHHHFSQDSQTLYGFASLGERELFRKLLKISGIGAKMALKMALNILSGASGEELSRYVTMGDVAALTRLPGIGKKTAERIIMELRDKLDGISIGGAEGSIGSSCGRPRHRGQPRFDIAGLQAGRGEPHGASRCRAGYGSRRNHTQSIANPGKAK
jgi:Holliday junction DNA helicase RuvA